MSRCECCNVILTPYELSARSITSNTYMMMCSKCLEFVVDEVAVVGDRKLLHEEVGTEVAEYYVQYNDDYYNERNYTDDTEEY